MRKLATTLAAAAGLALAGLAQPAQATPMKRLARLAAASLAAVLGLGTVFLTTVPAHATFHGRNGRIAYTLDKGSGAQIYTINPDGTGRRRRRRPRLVPGRPPHRLRGGPPERGGMLSRDHGRRRQQHPRPYRKPKGLRDDPGVHTQRPADRVRA